VLAYDRSSTLWDAARLLSVGEEGYAYRSAVGARVRTLPEFKEISEFFTAELSAQLADARSTTTAKLDAPVNKLARLLNSPSIKRVLLNGSLRVDFDQVIAREEVLVVKGALGAMGAGNTSVLMQLLVGMLDAALARQQDLVQASARVAVALKIDEAPLVLNRGFAETMALKRSAGLETVACWQTDAQWIDRDVREQLDALFAHRVYFATASARDARAAAALTMAEFSDTVRPGMASLSALGHPDVRLHLPKHHAIASWSTPAGRQPPFIATTKPLQVDRDRLAHHEARQHERGGRHLADLRQPHWERGPAAAAAAGSSQLLRQRSPVRSGDAHADATAAVAPAGTPALSYAELAELDGAQSVRWARRTESRTGLQPDQLDIKILGLIASLRHVLTTQIHRQFNPARAVTTTQRRLKRLADAGLVERFQFHRPDGGGIPMCYVISDQGMALLEADLSERRTGALEADVGRIARERAPARGQESGLLQARRDVHVAGWVLALMHVLGDPSSGLRGAEEAVLSPPRRSQGESRAPFGPSDLRLPGGRAPHDFLRSDTTGARLEVERFETVRPHAVVELSAEAAARIAGAEDGAAGLAIDVLVEFDDRPPTGPGAAKLERYDHFLSGWSTHLRRYGTRGEATPTVVFVCRDRARARACARAADQLMRACRAYAGEYPFDWEYPGREGVLYAAERDVHEGLLRAYGIPRLPPEVRVAATHGDPRAAETTLEERMIIDVPPASAG
jgi:hypothetical protein